MITKERQIRVALGLLLAGLFLAAPGAVLATSVDRLAMTNLEGYPGETIEAEITLKGTHDHERSGYWSTHYKEVEGDDERMDITAWITIEPEEYVITQEQTITFTVRVEIPDNARPGLYGATTEEAGRSGHSAERRTYVIFRDTPTGGSVYSGLLIPISVQVLGTPNPLTPVLDFIVGNILLVVAGAIIVVLAVLLLRKSRA